MKISLKLQEDQEVQYYRNPLIKAKIPVTIFNQPFTSAIATIPSTPTNSSSHLSFSLSSNFSSGPSVKLSYSHTSTTPSPFSLSLKSGLGLFGSPNHSPLVFTAHFSLSHTNPSFSLQIKPQFGNFSLKKTTFSDPNCKQISGSCPNASAHLDSGSVSNGDFGDGFVSEESSVWQELRLEPCGGKVGLVDSEYRANRGVHLNGGIGSVSETPLAWKNGGKDGLSGIAVMARTVLPVTKGVVVNMRWGVNFPAKFGTKMPYLTVNKIGIERVEELNVEKKKNAESNGGDLELLKGMCFWMSRDLEVLEKENREMKQRLEEMKLGVSRKHFYGESDAVGKRMLPPLGETSGEFERWRNKKSVGEENGKIESKKSTNHISDGEFERSRNKKCVKEDNGQIELKKNSNHASDLESELQRAIKAATG